MDKGEYLRVYPNPTTGMLHIEAQKLTEFHIIENIIITDAKGQIVKKFGYSPSKFSVDLSDLPNGNYQVDVKSNVMEKKFKVVLHKNN
jgi:hypothetical protein